MMLVIFLVLVVILLIVGYVLYRVVSEGPDRAELLHLRSQEADFAAANCELAEQRRLIGELRVEREVLKVKLEGEQRVTAEKIALLTEAEERLKREFENLANKIFDDKGRVFREQNKDGLGSLLQPLREQLDGFRSRIDEVHRDDTEQSARLIEQVRQLQELSNRVSGEANNLAKAIKGDAKVQGDWGELIVERLLEASGLEKGREFESQVSMRTGEGELLRPDFIVNLPGERVVVIDSKVSLTAYERYVNAEDEAVTEAELAAHLASVKGHVTELAAKNYENLLGNKALDFVLMCIPLEAAYQAALQADTEMMYTAAKTNIVIVSPATLMVALKLVAQMWRRDNENRNVEQIADRAGRMYDQVALVIEALEETRRKFGGAAESLDLVIRRISEGRGNLVGRIEEMKRLGAKVSRQLPEGYGGEE